MTRRASSNTRQHESVLERCVGTQGRQVRRVCERIRCTKRKPSKPSEQGRREIRLIGVRETRSAVGGRQAARKETKNTMKKLINAQKRVTDAEKKLSDVQQKAASAAAAYDKLVSLHAQVFAENGTKRTEAVNVAAQLIDEGYSLRSAAEAAGQEPNNKLQRYFTVARQMVKHMAMADDAIAPPAGFTSWIDAVAAKSLEDLCSHVASVRKPTERKVDDDAAIRKYINTRLTALQALLVGEASGKTVEGLSVGVAQFDAYVMAWLEADHSVAGLDALPLTAQDAETQEVIGGIQAAVQAAAQSLETETASEVAA